MLMQEHVPQFDVIFSGFKTLVQCGHLMRLIAQEDYIKFSCHESSETYVSLSYFYSHTHICQFLFGVSNLSLLIQSFMILH